MRKAPPKPQIRSRCSRCGRVRSAEELILSRHTGARFCPEFEVCDRRMRKAARQP